MTSLSRALSGELVVGGGVFHHQCWLLLTNPPAGRPCCGLQWPSEGFGEGFSLQDPFVDFDSQMQSMDGGLMQRNGCAAAAVHVATGIAEKWWQQNTCYFDGVAS